MTRSEVKPNRSPDPKHTGGKARDDTDEEPVRKKDKSKHVFDPMTLSPGLEI